MREHFNRRYGVPTEEEKEAVRKIFGNGESADGQESMSVFSEKAHAFFGMRVVKPQTPRVQEQPVNEAAQEVQYQQPLGSDGASSKKPVSEKGPLPKTLAHNGTTYRVIPIDEHPAFRAASRIKSRSSVGKNGRYT